MLDYSKKLTDGLIIFSALVSDYERLDFKNDALAGVRANYFNSNCTQQQDRTEIVLDDKNYNLSYLINKDNSLSWKITNNNRPIQSVKKTTGGVYCVLFYGDNGIIFKRQYYNSEHIWIRTEYYDRVFENRLLSIVYPKNICGVVALRFEKYSLDKTKIVLDLFPSDKAPRKKCSALVYSNVGMLWYDESFKPDDLIDDKNSDNRSDDNLKRGFMLKIENFSDDFTTKEPLDLDAADYLDYDNIQMDSQEKSTDEEDNCDSNQGYSAYDKIERILAEAHKSNKDLFGEIISQTSEEVVQEDVSVPEKLSEDENEYEPLNEAEESQNTDDSIEDSKQADYEREEEPAGNLVVVTKNGRYTYYGEIDENSCRTGRGRTVTPDGVTSYDGEYKDDKRNGFGVCYYKDGQINYAGQWIDNTRSGSGVGYRLSDGTMHAGKWDNNSPDSIGARFDSEGNFIDVCFYVDGVRNGKSVSFDEDGNVVISFWENGNKIDEKVIDSGE